MPKSKKKEIIDTFRQLSLPNLQFSESSIVINHNNEVFPLLYIENNNVELNFYWYNARSGEYNLRNDIESIKFPTYVNLEDILLIRESDYRLPLVYLVKNILGLERASDINKIELTKRKNILNIDSENKILKISVNKYLQILYEAWSIYRKSREHRRAYERYLTNLAIEKFFSRKVKRRTLISPGDINFTVQRLNLQTKTKKTDFQNYINNADINAVEDLATAFIKHEMFNNEFLRKLNDYFIRENLQEIIKLGRKILSLKSQKMNTNQAKEVILEISGDRRKIKQLETLWQKYFEKYLLYLIFSYKGIFPKIHLTDIEGDKKHPDFIGINHYNGVDIIEIKTHLKNALVYDKSHKNYAFSSELSKAVIQTMNYIDAIIHTNFKKPEDREKITNSSHEENLNRPRGIIIISSYDKLVGNYRVKDKNMLIRDFTKLRNSVHNIEILTFDEILDIAEDYIQNIINKEEEL